MPTIQTYNHLTGEEEMREMNASELAEYNDLIERAAERKAEEKAQREAAESALLSSLGITKEQAVVLGLLQPDYVKPNLG